MTLSVAVIETFVVVGMARPPADFDCLSSRHWTILTTCRQAVTVYELCRAREDHMKARIDWIRDLTFVGESNSGHGIVISAPKQAGAPTIAPSPMEYVLLGTGGCTRDRRRPILEKGRHEVTAL